MHIDEQGDLASDAGSGTEEDVTLEEEDDLPRGDVDVRGYVESQSIDVEPILEDEPNPGQLVAVQAPTSVKTEPGMEDEHHPTEAVVVRDGALALSHVGRDGALALSHVGSHIENEDEPTKHARTSLQSEIQRKYDATYAAIEAAKNVGGDTQLVDTLQQRLRSLARQFRASGDRGRLRLRVMRLHQKELAKKLRADSVAEENRRKELKLEVKLREAEAVKAREKGKEAAAAARKEANEARLRAKEQARRAAEEKEAQTQLRFKFAAKLCGEQRAYMGASSQGHERTLRARKLAVAAAFKEEGLKAWPVPLFWPPTTTGRVYLGFPL